MKNVLPVVILCCFVVNYAGAEDTFTDQGQRIDPQNLPEGVEHRSIFSWADKAAKARSQQFRHQAASVIEILAYNTNGGDFSDEELKELAKAAAKLLSSTDEHVRIIGARAAKGLQAQSCCKSLIAAMKDRSSQLRNTAISAAGACGCEDAASPLAVIALKDEECRYAAVEALGIIGTAAAKKSLEDLRKRANDESFREAVNVALDAIETAGVK